MVEFVEWLQDFQEERAAAMGGKGANLGRLMRLGVRVPPGFVLTTEAYRTFVVANRLGDTGPEELRQQILSAPVPPEVTDELFAGYQILDTASVAVRSSGTAEDTETASFAGQHDTFLDISGEDTLLNALRGCWASLWSERAVDYRRIRQWDDSQVAIAVVVQAMVRAEWAGILFTADPVTGRRDQIVLEAVEGLGEALVSGLATGQHIKLDKSTGRLLEGTPPLPQAALTELVGLAKGIEATFAKPQDIEWAYAANKVYLLQTRPITTLPPEPAA